MDKNFKQELLSMVEQVPAFPRSVNRVIELTNDVNCSAKQIVEVIEHDPVLTIKMLKMVNSAHFGLRNHINSINHALVYLGLNTVKNLALSIAIIGISKGFKSSVLNVDDFLLHALLVASIARKLSEKFPVKPHERTDYFVAGLLHDFGKLVFVQFKHEAFEKAFVLVKEKGISLHAAESEVFGVNHAEVGAMLGEHWRLSESLNQSIRFHHDRENDEGVLGDYVFVANQVVKFLGWGNSGNALVESFPDKIRQTFGTLEDVVGVLGDLESEREKAQTFMGL